MLKSIFAKYVITFVVLLSVSFMLLLFIVDSVVTNYSLREERRDLRGVAVSCADNLSEMYGLSGMADFGDFIREGTEEGRTDGDHIHRVLDAIMTNFEDMTVYVTDASGGFIFSTGRAAQHAPAMGTPLLTDRDFEAMSSDRETAAPIPPMPTRSDSETEEQVAGTFLQDHPLLTHKRSFGYVYPVETPNKTAVGYVLVVSTAETWSNLMNTTVRSVAVAALWIFLAALIAIYFITERTVAPLRDMSRAVKRMSVGQYDVRVRVQGRDEVAELAVAFNQMAESLENLERMRNSFVASVSHDLRTPMTTISGFIDALLDGTIPPEKQEYYLRMIGDEVRRLSRLVAALLDVSRIQAGDRKFVMSAFDICEMARVILISFEQKIDKKRLDVEFDIETENLYVWADRDAIYQILYNICDNGVKFAREDGKYRIRIIERDRKVFVSVFNEGNGIKSEELPHVFERFYKTDKSRGLDKTGVGLGLYIAKSIIDAHSEEIWVKSKYGEYCEFIFTLKKASDSQVKKSFEKQADEPKRLGRAD